MEEGKGNDVKHKESFYGHEPTGMGCGIDGPWFFVWASSKNSSREREGAMSELGEFNSIISGKVRA